MPSGEPSPSDIGRFHRRALELADEARRIVRAALATGFRAERKDDGSLVTSADRAVEERLRELIAAYFPDHGVLGEELPPENPASEFQWILDPVDGTEEFANRIPTFGSIIGLHWRGGPLVGVLDFPALDLRVHAALGCGCWRDEERVRLDDEPRAEDRLVRFALSARANFTRYLDDGAVFDRLTREFPNHRIYRSCLAQALAASGALDVVVEWHDKIWDLAAVEILLSEAGGKYALVREHQSPAGTVYSAVFGRTALVDRLRAELG
jgi:fructose-1,6-bisphosphatase/inositol monophosphatase family enzyme